MTEADLVVVVGRKLDYQLGYGSPAVFPNARFIRIADTAGELIDNRRGAPEILATPALALDAIVEAMGNAAPNLDTGWADAMRRRQLQRAGAGFGDTPALGPDGKIHPRCIFDAIAEVAAPDYIAIADGGDLLSFARIGLAPARTYMDAGAFGCLGVGVPFGVAAALAFPERQVISVNGDGAFGINAMEIDTAVRHGAKAVFIVSNNAAWNIERYDQEMNYGGRVVGTTLRHSDYAAHGAGARRAWRAGGAAGGTRGQRWSARWSVRRPWSTWSPRRRRSLRTPRRDWASSPTTSRSRPGMKPSGGGARSERKIRPEERADHARFGSSSKKAADRSSGSCRPHRAPIRARIKGAGGRARGRSELTSRAHHRDSSSAPRRQACRSLPAMSVGGAASGPCSVPIGSSA